MSYILVIWTMVAMGGTAQHYEKYDWRAIGEFNTEAHCISGGERVTTHHQLMEGMGSLRGTMKTKTYMCLEKGTKK